ncbi:hypothetical protein PWT90_02331 [Aphanocladium album]|nr:hypothetical protein PWT90_02331 [Aphanocladium album]
MSQRRRKPLSPYLPDAHDSVVTPLGYVLEWTPQSHHRHRLDTIDNLRSELLGGEPPGVEQLIVLRGDGRVSADVSDALRSLAGVDGAFVEAFAQGKPFRPRGRAKGARWWTWRYPEEEQQQSQNHHHHHHHRGSLVRRASLWLSSPIPVLLVDSPLEPLGKEDRKHKPAPRLRHQDAATRRSGLQHGTSSGGGRYGAVATYHTSPRQQQQQHHHQHVDKAKAAPVRTLDDELCGAMDHVQEVVVEEILAELVYERWTACLGTLRLGGNDERAPRLLWNYMVALERNLDDARYCARQGRFVEHASPPAWTDLAQRAQLRIQLAAAAAAASQDSSSSSSSARRPAVPSRNDDCEPSANERSLDRIAYLGGMLLPVTVVAGVLAIEGRYGPEGPQFWVFWVASVAASVAALLVIYLDQLRLAEVWIEMPARAAGAGAEEGNMVVGAAGLGVVNGGKMVAAARAWHREQLGWVRALKQATGYYRLRGARWIRFQSPAKAEEEDRKEDIIVVEEE